MALFKYVVIFPLLAFICQAYKNYAGYRTYEVDAKNKPQLDYLHTLRKNSTYDFLLSTSILRNPTHIMVPPSEIKSFEKIMQENNFNFIVLVHDVKNVLPNEVQHRNRLLNVPKDGNISFNRFERYETIQAYLNSLATNKPKLVTLINLGKTYEGRDLQGIKISSGERNRPAIFVDAGIHAREWIAPAMALYIIDQVVNRTNGANMLRKVDWYVIPVLNPDGYEYSHTHDRFWRKTRSRHGRECYGTDANRNFGFHWNEGGASSDECSPIYAGPAAFSEPETLAMKNFVEKIKSNIKLYLTFHSHGQYLFYPWSWTTDYPENRMELHALAEIANTAIKQVGGTTYKIGSPTNLLYACSGGSDDWMMGVAGVPLTYTFELPAGGFFGFDPKPSAITGVVKETFEGIKILTEYVAKYHDIFLNCLNDC